MKKLSSVLLAASVVFALAGCGGGDPVPDDKKETEEFTEEAFLEEIQPNLDCLESCFQELYGAEVDFETAYGALYETEADSMDREKPPAMLYVRGEQADFSDYAPDPAEVTYYPVFNYQTNADARAYLEQYLSGGMIEKWFYNDFLEYGGKLYLARGARGYGEESLDRDSLIYVEEKNGNQYAKIDVLLFGEYERTELLEFTEGENGWVLTGESETAAG